MKMKFLLLVILSLYFFPVDAQKYTVTPLAEFKGNSSNNKSDAIYHKGKIYSLEVTARRQLAYTATIEKLNFSVSIIQFDDKGNLLKEVKLDEGEDGFGPIMPQYAILNDQLYLRYFTYNKETGLSMHLSVVNDETAKAELSEPLLSISQKNIGIFKLSKFINDYNVEFGVSPDGNRIVFVFTTGLTNQYSYTIVNKNIEVMYAGTAEVENEKSVIVGNSIVTNEGDFYATLRNKIALSNNFYLLQGKEKTKKIKNIPLPQDDYKISTAAVVAGYADNAVNVIGVSAEEKGYMLTALYAIPVNTLTLKTGMVKRQEIPAAIVKQYDKDGYGGKKGLNADAKFSAYRLSDGSAILLGDLSRTMNTEKRTLIYKGNIVVGIFSASGSISVGTIPKRETYGGYDYNSFFAHNAGDKLHIVYTDSPENLAKPLGEGALVLFSSKKDNNLVIASIDGKGSVNRNVINPKSPSGYFFQSAYCASISKNKFQLSLVQTKVGFSNLNTKNFLSVVEIE